MLQAGSSTRERELYDLGPRWLAAGRPLPDLPLHEIAHLLRGMWDHAGFIGPNNQGYPVVSLVSPSPLAESIAEVIQKVTGKRSPARPLHGHYWVGVSGRTCAPWLEYLYGNATVASRRKAEQARSLMERAACPGR